MRLLAALVFAPTLAFAQAPVAMGGGDYYSGELGRQVFAEAAETLRRGSHGFLLVEGAEWLSRPHVYLVLYTRDVSRLTFAATEDWVAASWTIVYTEIDKEGRRDFYLGSGVTYCTQRFIREHCVRTVLRALEDALSTLEVMRPEYAAKLIVKPKVTR